MTWIFFVGVLCIFQLGLGIAIGMRLRKNADFIAPTPQATIQAPQTTASGSNLPIKGVRDEDIEHRNAATLRELATGIADDVASHSERIERATRSLDGLASVDSQQGGKMLASSAAQILRANEELQRQLAASRLQLELQTKELDARLVESRTDGLTGIANRRACDETLARCCSEASKQGPTCSLVMMDVDHFKSFNDTHGHDAGDYVLRQVAQTIARAVGPADLAARYGGEEFCAILPATTLEDAQLLAERVRLAVFESSFNFNGVDLKVTLSLGVASCAVSENEPSLLVRRADAALYASKHDGRNCGHFSDGSHCHRIGRTPAAPAIAEEDGLGLKLDPRAIPATTAETLERRAAERRRFNGKQAIARYEGGAIPDASSFRAVTCQDLSATGLCFISDVPLGFSNLVVALGAPPHLTYVAAQVAYETPLKSKAKVLYRVGCRFLGRVDKAGNRPDAAPELVFAER